jgi:hypothetical protein
VPTAQAAPPPRHLDDLDNLDDLDDLARTGSAGFLDDGHHPGPARLNGPAGLAIASDGRVAVADWANNRVRILGSDGLIFTLTGTGTSGFSGDDGAARAAQLDHPTGVAWTPDGGLLIADSMNHRVRKVSDWPHRITTVAGNGAPGFGGDGGPATDAQLKTPAAVAPTPDDGFLIADAANKRIRKVSSNGTITTVAGAGQPAHSGDGGPATAAGLDVSSVAAQPDGGFLIADFDNARLRRVTRDGTISTIAGTGTAGSGGDGGPATAAQLNMPIDVAVAGDGRVLVADIGGDRVRWIDPAGIIHTLAGAGMRGYHGCGRDAGTVRLSKPHAVAVGPSGEVMVADFNGNRLRLIRAVPPTP